MNFTEDSADIQLKIIGHTPACSTAIVWVKGKTPEEVHTNEQESFFIIEGNCIINIGTKSYEMMPGDFLSIPMFENHHVVVTSTMPCKVILQRLAA